MHWLRNFGGAGHHTRTGIHAGITQAVFNLLIDLVLDILVVAHPVLVSDKNGWDAAGFKIKLFGHLLKQCLVVLIVPDLVHLQFNVGIFFRQRFQIRFGLRAVRAAIAPEEVNHNFVFGFGSRNVCRIGLSIGCFRRDDEKYHPQQQADGQNVNQQPERF